MVALPEADVTLSNLILLFKIKYVWEIIITQFQVAMHGLLSAFQCCSLEPVLYLPGTNKPVMVFKEGFVMFICVCGLASNSVFSKNPKFLIVTVKYRG